MPEGPEAFVYVLLGLDAGLRQGEALGLRWGAIGGRMAIQTRLGICW